MFKLLAPNLSNFVKTSAALKVFLVAFLISLILQSIQTSANENPLDVQALHSCSFNTQLDAWECEQGDTHYQSQLDWIPLAYLSPKKINELTPGCSGAYIDPFQIPSNTDRGSNDEIASSPLVIEADYSEVNQVNFAKLEGNVRVSQGDRSIGAESMVYDRTQDQATLSGDVSIRQPGMFIKGGLASVSTIDRLGEFQDGEFLMHDTHMRGSAGKIRQEGKSKIVLENGAISSCEPGSNAWVMEGKELGVDSEKGQGYGKHIRLKLGGVPVFYLPYISFPVGDQRRTGFLFPSLSNSDDGGLDISVPYYINLAENYDLTLTPRLITGRGAMLESEFRHLDKYFFTQVSAAFLGNDDGGEKNITLENDTEVNRHIGSDRWLFQLKQNGGSYKGWYSKIDFTRTSDEDYFRDLGTSAFSIANTTYLNKSVEAGTTLRNWNLYARIQDYQTLLFNLDSPYIKLPELSATGVFDRGPFQFSLSSQATRFDHGNSVRLDGSPILTGERFVGDYRVSTRFQRPWMYIKPEAGYKQLAYRLHAGPGDELIDDSIQLGASQASLDVGLVFEHQSGSYTQTLEPRSFFLYRQYKDHSTLYNAIANATTPERRQSVNFDTTTRNFSFGQLYRDSRFSGTDRLDDANQATLGLTNRWISNSDSHEAFHMSVGRIVRFRDRRVGLEQDTSDATRTSEWAMEFGLNWRNGSGLFGSVVYDGEADETSRFSAGYNFASKNQLSLFNLSYSYLRADPEITDSEETNQGDAAFIAPVHKQWYVMGRANYDFENDQELESFFGLEYNNCCYRFRVVARRWLDSNIANLTEDDDAIFDQGIFFEIHLKGLGGSGAKVNSIIEDALPGYRRREELLNKH